MKFVVLNNIEKLKKIFTPYILTALKEKYMESYQRKCLDEINEEYKDRPCLVDSFGRHSFTICHYSSIDDPHGWKYDVADFPKRFIYSSGMNCPNGFKEYDL